MLINFLLKSECVMSFSLGFRYGKMMTLLLYTAAQLIRSIFAWHTSLQFIPLGGNGNWVWLNRPSLL